MIADHRTERISTHSAKSVNSWLRWNLMVRILGFLLCSGGGSSLILLPFLTGCFGGPVPDPPNIKTSKVETPPPTARPINYGGTSAEDDSQANPGLQSNTTPDVTPTQTTAPVQPASPADDSNNTAAAGMAGGAEDESGEVESNLPSSEEPVGANADSGTFGPGDASFDPSSIEFDPSSIENVEVRDFPTLSITRVLIIKGGPSALLPGQVLWVWNLNSTYAPVIATPQEDGSFQLQVLYDEGDVLRFQIREGDDYLEPVDLQLEENNQEFVPVEYPSCIAIVKQLSIQQNGQISIDNQCSETVTIKEITWRTFGAAIAVDSAAGVVIEPFDTYILNLYTTANQNLRWTDEDILIITVQLADVETRYFVNIYTL